MMNAKAILLLSLFALPGCSGTNNKDINKVQLEELNGSPVDLSQYDGKAVFINFWATWCKPCIQEMPTIADARKLNKNVVFLLASDEEPGQIEKFISRHDFDLQYVRLVNMEELNIQALPTTFIFNPEGKLKFSETGFRIWNDSASIELLKNIANNHEK
jgi:thiol-disulfide isomerase/thioredoxin